MAKAYKIGEVSSGGLVVAVYSWGNVAVRNSAFEGTILNVQPDGTLHDNLCRVFPSDKTEWGVARSKELCRLVRELRAARPTDVQGPKQEAG